MNKKYLWVIQSKDLKGGDLPSVESVKGKAAVGGV